jgi:hypothetical protein
MVEQILDIDESIRFIGFADKSGNKLISLYRRGLKPLLTEDELKLQATKCAMMIGTKRFGD